jgi:hypothetical protein
MAIHTGLLSIVIPRRCIDSVFPGGFEEYKNQKEAEWVLLNEHPLVGGEFVWFDESIVVVHASFNPGLDTYLDEIEYWVELGLNDEVHIGLVDTQGTDCPWLIFDEESGMVRAGDNLPQFE